MEQPKEYKIDSFKTLLNVVSKENVENLSVDLAHFLCQYVALIERVRKEHPGLADKTNYEICQGYFVWIDDGKTDVLATKIINTDTGETTTIKNPNLQ